MPRPIHFEMPVDDPDRAAAFYRDAFGWTITAFEGAPRYYGVATTGTDGPGIDGGFFQRVDAEGNSAGTSVSIGVDSIEEAAAKITAGGGKVVSEKMPIPGVGWFAACEDTEGNRFGIFKDDPSATMA